MIGINGQGCSDVIPAEAGIQRKNVGAVREPPYYHNVIPAEAGIQRGKIPRYARNDSRGAYITPNLMPAVRHTL